MATKKFFDESREQSEIKATIVSKYFWAWANVMKSAQKKHRGDRIAYIDLFCGPGRYKDGSVSTPVMILQQAAEDEYLRNALVARFNDKDRNNTKSLEEEIAKIPNIESLKYMPQIAAAEIDEDIAKYFEGINLVPTLFFLDPWGYKGLSLRLVNSVLKNWGCDCIFFFNYNRINMGLNNPLVEEHMNALFGDERADDLRKRLEDLSPDDKELTIVEELTVALQEIGGKYTLPFRFKDERGTRTSHHLVFVSKHHLGYTIMKEIMAKSSTDEEQGVATFEYNPAGPQHPTLFMFSRPLDDLGPMLFTQFAGKCLTMKDIFDRHHIGTRYVIKNYKDVLQQLETEGKITADPPMSNRRKNTFADKVLVTFPPTKD